MGSGTKLRLDPDAPMGRAFVHIQRALFSALLQAETGVHRQEQKSLHDFRVAMRRTRVLHRIGRDVLRDTEHERWRESLERVWRATGPARDLDVFEERLQRVDGDFADDAKGLAGILRIVRWKRRDAWRAVHSMLESREYAAFIEAGRRLFDPDGSHDVAIERAGELAKSGPVLSEWSASRIASAYRRLRKKARRIDPSSDEAELHKLRIRAKQLRYRMEFFRSLYPKRDVRSLIEEVTRLQDVLGEFNDADVQIAMLRECGAQSYAQSEALVTIGRLIERALQRKARGRAQFAAAFERFDRRRNRVRFEQLFGC